MSAADEKHRDSQLPAIPSSPSDTRLDGVRNFAGDHPWLIVAAGAGAGLLLGSLLPRKAGSKTASRAFGLAAAGAELALALSKTAREAAEESAREGIHKLDEGTAPLRRRAGEVAGSASRSAQNAGARIAGEAIRAVARLRK